MTETARRWAPLPSDGRGRYDDIPEAHGMERAITAAAPPAGPPGNAAPEPAGAMIASAPSTPARLAPPPAELPRETLPRPVSAAQRERVLTNPVVRQVMELLGAELVNIEVHDTETGPG